MDLARKGKNVNNKMFYIPSSGFIVLFYKSVMVPHFTGKQYIPLLLHRIKWTICYCYRIIQNFLVQIMIDGGFSMSKDMLENTVISEIILVFFKLLILLKKINCSQLHRLCDIKTFPKAPIDNFCLITHNSKTHKFLRRYQQYLFDYTFQNVIKIMEADFEKIKVLDINMLVLLQLKQNFEV